MPGKRLTASDRLQICARWIARAGSVADLAGVFGVGERTISRVLHAAGLREEHRIAARPAAAERPQLREQFAGLGPPPADPVEAGEYMHRGLMLAFRQAGMDEAYDSEPAARRAELVRIARAAAACLPQATIARTIRLIRDDAEERDGDDAGPQEEELPARARGALRSAPVRGPRRDS